MPRIEITDTKKIMIYKEKSAMFAAHEKGSGHIRLNSDVDYVPHKIDLDADEAEELGKWLLAVVAEMRG